MEFTIQNLKVHDEFENIRNTGDNNGKSSEIRLSVLIIQVDRIAVQQFHSCPVSIQRSLCDDCMVVLVQQEILPQSYHGVDQFYLPHFSRINICYNTVRSKPYTFQ